MNLIRVVVFIIICLAGCLASGAIYFAENPPENILNGLKNCYPGWTLKVINSLEALEKENKADLNFFFHSDDKIVPTISASGKYVNVYFYKNTNQMAPASWNEIENISSFDLIFTESMQDLQQFLGQANPILIKLASESKYVPLIRIIKPTDNFKQKVTGIVGRIKKELPFKEYIQEALPIFKSLAISIEPKTNATKNVAVIFESSVHPALELCVRNVMYYLKSNWSLIIYHSRENEMFIKNALKDLKNVEYRIPENQIYSVSEYNQYMLKAEFYKSLQAKKVLIFQTDSIMLKEGMDQFLKYDYAGAPWPWLNKAGNGGFSLRTVNVMTEACIKCNNGISVRLNEDLYFSDFVENNYKMIPYREAYMFSREHWVPELNSLSVEGGNLDGHMAIHQIWLMNPASTVRRILRASLMKLKAEKSDRISLLSTNSTIEHSEQ